MCFHPDTRKAKLSSIITLALQKQLPSCPHKVLTLHNHGFGCLKADLLQKGKCYRSGVRHAASLFGSWKNICRGLCASTYLLGTVSIPYTHTHKAVTKKLAVPHVCGVDSALLAERILRESSGHGNTYLWLITSHFLGFRICFCAYAGIWVCLRLWEFTAL